MYICVCMTIILAVSCMIDGRMNLYQCAVLLLCYLDLTRNLSLSHLHSAMNNYRTAYDVSVNDDNWSKDLFDIISGNLSRSWERLDG